MLPVQCRQKESSKAARFLCSYFPKLHPERKMSTCQPFKKVDRRNLNFLEEQKLQKKYNLNSLALKRFVTRKARAFLYRKGLDIRLLISGVMHLQTEGAMI